MLYQNLLYSKSLRYKVFYMNFYFKLHNLNQKFTNIQLINLIKENNKRIKEERKKIRVQNARIAYVK